MVMIDEEGYRAINPEVTDQYGGDAEGRTDQRATQQCAIIKFRRRPQNDTSNWLMSLNVS